jgi:hypothetical protein
LAALGIVQDSFPQNRIELRRKIVKAFKTLGLGWGFALAAAAMVPAPDASAQECTPCSRLPSVIKCVRCSIDSPKAKQMGYPESGIRRWCEENQPKCYLPVRR